MKTEADERRSREGRVPNWLYDEADARRRLYGIPAHTCPVCGRDHLQEPWLWERDRPIPVDHNCVSESIHLWCEVAAGLEPKHLEFDFAAAEPTPITRAVADYCADFVTHVREGHGLVFMAANYGSGKTTGLVQLITHALGLGYEGNAALVKFKTVIDAYKRSNAEEYDAWLQRLRILAIDEVIAPKSDAQAILFDRFAAVVDGRYATKRPVFLAGNISVAELEQHYPKVFSRLHEMADFVEVPDIDFRKAVRTAPTRERPTRPWLIGRKPSTW